MNLDTIEFHKKTPPEILYLEPGANPYRAGYRLHRRDVSKDMLVRSSYGPETVWVCLDIDNGNPEMLLGRVYTSKQEALDRYNNTLQTSLTLGS